jgi:prepilin-type N-terminal cleavage/methylation domain-containing protein
MTLLSRVRRLQRKRSRGYTAVEVLTAMTLFAVGAAGVIGMLKVVIQGGSDARRFDIATNIANMWTARLQRDAMFWTLPNSANPTTSNMVANTRWLRDISANSAQCNGLASGGKFCIPNLAIPTATNEYGVSSAFDVFGRDMPAYAVGKEHFFCVQYRLSWMSDPMNPTCATNEPCFTGLMRADIRVFWRRQEYGTIPDCAAANPDATPNQFHFVHATTGIRENQLQ